MDKMAVDKALEGLPLQNMVIAVGVLMWAFELTLDLRQLKVLKTAGVPAIMKGFITEADSESVRQYSLDKWYLHVVAAAWSQVQSVVLLTYGLLPWFWAQAGQLTERVGYTAGTDVTVHSVFFALLLSVVGPLPDLPLKWYSHFVVEAKHGFNKMTLSTFVVDEVKTLALTAVFLPPILAAAIAIDRVAGPLLALYLLAFFVGIQFAFLTIYPVLIAPLFNKYDPFPDGPLKSKIEKLAESIKYPLRKLFVMDASQRSGHGNAYLYGFGRNKRIVLYDTLIDQCKDDDELVVAVLAHELGHWNHSHIIWLMGSSITMIGVQLGGFAFLRECTPLLTGFGFDKSVGHPLILAFLVFNYVVTPTDPFLKFVLNLLTRSCEYQADAFANTLGYSQKLKEGLIRLSKENKSQMSYDHMYSAYHHSHPTLVQRLEALDVPTKKGQ